MKHKTVKIRMAKADPKDLTGFPFPKTDPDLTAEQWIILRLILAVRLTVKPDASEGDRHWAHEQQLRAYKHMVWDACEIEPAAVHRAMIAFSKEPRPSYVSALDRTGPQRPETFPPRTRDDEVWTTADGQRIPVGEMDADHARNALRMVLRKQREKAFQTYITAARREIRREADPDYRW